MSEKRSGTPLSSRLKPGSQNDAIIAVLSDGNWHTTADIHRRAGFSRLNSRVSELRQKHGYLIEQRHIDGAGSGPHAHEYRLTARPSGEGEQTPPAGLTATSPASNPTSTSPRLSDCSPSPDGLASGWGVNDSRPSGTFEQLRLVA